MNPLLISAGADVIKSGEATNILKEVRKPFQTLMIIAIIAIGVIILWKITKKWREKWQSNKFNNIDISKDKTGALASTYANRIEAAFSWYNDDEEAIYQVGREMKANGVSFAQVAVAYKLGFQTDLAQKLSSRLNATELRKFYTAAGLTIY